MVLCWKAPLAHQLVIAAALWLQQLVRWNLVQHEALVRTLSLWAILLQRFRWVMWPWALLQRFQWVRRRWGPLAALDELPTLVKHCCPLLQH